MASAQGSSDLWIRRFPPLSPSAARQPGGNRTGGNGAEGDHPGLPRLLCFPHAGGSASFFRPLSAHLNGVAEVLAVQYPGRQDRRSEPFIPTIDGLADAIFEQLDGWNPRQLMLFGHSMGATLAYEVARRMEVRSAIPPLGVFASGRRAPSVLVEENIHLRGDQGLIADVRQLSGTDARLLDDEEVLAMILPAVRADYTAIETYRHRPGRELSCPIIALVGEDDARATADEVRAWKVHTTAGFDMRVFPGGHFYLSEQWPAVGEAISSGMALFGCPATGTRESRT